MGGEKTRALVIIDPQNDFCDPRGSLYVGGAEEDILRLSSHITSRGHEYSGIFVSLDSHDATAIFHPKFWIGENGNNPAPFTPITGADYASGVWRVACGEHEPYAEKMFAAMEAKKIDSLTVWPEHCVVSTWGHGLPEALSASLASWRGATGRAVRYVFKGENPYTEQFSIFEGIDDSWPETAFNENLASRLAEFDAITFAGEALSHCVEASVASYAGRFGRARQEICLLSDCASPVAGFDRGASEARIASLGVRLVQS